MVLMMGQGSEVRNGLHEPDRRHGRPARAFSLAGPPGMVEEITQAAWAVIAPEHPADKRCAF
jgi:hypothetical protein